ncbi:MAG TPA: AtpZ/AtpI family protein, partial [Longimicrobiales bacterium]
MPKDGPEVEEGPRGTLSAVGQHAGYGLTIAGSVGLFMLVGWWLDERLGITPLLTILGAFLGGTAGFYSMYRHLVLAPREER